MKLKCNIKGKEYDIVQGATFSEEYNETLDSGSIILSHIKDRIEDLKVYDDVFIYSDDYAFNGYAETEYFKVFHPEKKTVVKNEPIIQHCNFLDCTDETDETDEIKKYAKPIQNILLDKTTSDIEQEKFYYDVQLSPTNTETNCLYSKLSEYIISEQAIYKQYLYDLSKAISDTAETTTYATLNFNIMRDRVHMSINYLITNNYYGTGKNEQKYIFGGKIIDESQDWYLDGEYYYRDVKFTDGTIASGENSLLLKFGCYVSDTEHKNITRVIFDFANATYRTKIAIRKNFGLLDAANSITLSLTDTTDGIFNLTPLVQKEDIYAYGQFRKETTTIVPTYYIYEDDYVEKVSGNNIEFGLVNQKTFYNILDLKYQFNYDLLSVDNYDNADNKVYIETIKDRGSSSNEYLEIEYDEEEKKYYVEYETKKYYFNETRDLEFNVYYELEFKLYGFYDFNISKIEYTYSQENTHKNFFYKHMLIDDFDENILNVGSATYEYKIRLFSETKGLETIQLPNVSITQPIDKTQKKSIWQYLQRFVNNFSPKYKIKVNDKEWKYTQKYKLDSSLGDIFRNVYSPDFTLNAPNLRDVISQLMIVKDRIPYVEDGIIKSIDITQINGEFSKNNVSLIQTHLSSQNYCDGLRRNYSGGLGEEKSCHMVEYIGFRNSSTPLMTLDNMRLETSFPIYKINKLYLCYYKKCVSSKNEIDEQSFLCTQDITDLIKLNQERQMLSKDWEQLEKDLEELKDTSTIKDVIDILKKYYMSTIGYSMESNNITGWGDKYTYPDSILGTEIKLFDFQKTVIENIYTFFDKYNPYGDLDENYLTNYNEISLRHSGSINDIFTPIESQSLKLKSFFFLADYEAFYNGAIVQYKDDSTSDDIITNDNSSSSLTLLERDGIAQKEKVNRYSNKNYNIPARYYNKLDYTGAETNKFDIQKLGSELTIGNEDNIIVYHREYSIYDNCVKAVYYASKDYVQKNFFTSVYARHRTWNLMSYDESINRQENRRQNILLSTDKLYYEEENIFSFKNINGFIAKLFSAFSPSPIYLTEDYAPKYDNINYAILVLNGECYASDINKFVSGSSLCFNMKMFDNASMGVYVDKVSSMKNNNTGEGLDTLLTSVMQKIVNEGFTGYVMNTISGTLQSLTKVSDDYTGSSQKWYITTDDVETGENAQIGFYVGHLDQSSIFGVQGLDILTSKAKVQEIYQDYIFAFPKINYLKIKDNKISGNNASNLTNVIGNTFDIYKDNKERIDMTFQFDAITNDKNIVFSQWLMKLSDFTSTYNKVDETYVIPKKSTVNKAKLYLSVAEKLPRDLNTLIGANKVYPIATMLIDSNALNSIKNSTYISSYNFEFKLLYDTSLTIFGSFKKLIYLKITLLGKTDIVPTNSKILLNARYQYTYQDENGSTENVDVKDTIVFYRGNESHAELDDYNNLYYNLLRNKDGYNAYYWSLRYLPKQNNSGYFDMYGSDWFCSVEHIHDIFFQPELEYAFKKGESLAQPMNYKRIVPNMYKGSSAQNSMNDKFLFAEDTIDIVVKEEDSKAIEKNMFVVANEEELKKYSIYDSPTVLENIVENANVSDIFKIVDNNRIRVELSSFTNSIKSVQYWYYDGKYYNLVFGVNITQADIERGYVDIYISSLSKRDTRVYDYHHNVIGYIKNYANDNKDNYGLGNFYEAID